MTNATRRLMAQGDRLIEYAPTGATRNAHAAQRAAVVKGPALHRARGAQLMTNRWTWGCPRHRVAFLGGGQGVRQGVGVVDLPGYVSSGRVRLGCPEVRLMSPVRRWRLTAKLRKVAITAAPLPAWDRSSPNAITQVLVMAALGVQRVRDQQHVGQVDP